MTPNNTTGSAKNPPTPSGPGTWRTKRSSDPRHTELPSVIEGRPMNDQTTRHTFVRDDDERMTGITQPPDAEYPHIPHPIIRPAVGSPYYVDPRTGWGVSLSRPGT